MQPGLRPQVRNLGDIDLPFPQIPVMAMESTSIGTLARRRGFDAGDEARHLFVSAQRDQVNRLAVTQARVGFAEPGSNVPCLQNFRESFND